MGSTFGRPVTSRAKRTAADAGLDDSSEGAADDGDGWDAPAGHVRQRLRTTSAYIHQTLFVNGEGSDVTVCALNHEWRLHKVYLKQAGYFGSLFSGRWRETDDRTVNVEVLDSNVDKSALSAAFESLYCDDISLSLSNIVGVLAAATLLQIDGLVQLCAAQMAACMCAGTVSSFYEAGLAYGRDDVVDAAVTWLERHLCTNMPSDALRDIGTDLMALVVRSPRLLVIHVELDVYVVLRRWLYLRVCPAAVLQRGRNVVGDSAAFFRGRPAGGVSGAGDGRSTATAAPAFLDTEEGRPYLAAFRSLRMAHMVNDHRNIDVIARDNVIPPSWLDASYRSLWLLMLRGGWDTSAARDDFSREGLRCGRMLLGDAQLTWRWMGFSYGFDVLVTYHSASRMITLRRNTKALHGASPTTVCLQPRRKLIYRVSVGALDASELVDADHAPPAPPASTPPTTNISSNTSTTNNSNYNNPLTPTRTPGGLLSPNHAASPQLSSHASGGSVETGTVGEPLSYFKCTDVCEQQFSLNEEVVAITVDADAVFPLYVSLTMMFPRNPA
eukprot:Opistho-2@10683